MYRRPDIRPDTSKVTQQPRCRFIVALPPHVSVSRRPDIRPDPPPATVACASNSSSLVASGGGDRRVLMWDLQAASRARGRGGAGGSQCTAELNGHRGAVWSVAFAPSSSSVSSAVTIASGAADSLVLVWDATPSGGGSSSAPLYTLRGHTDTVFCVAFSPTTAADGRHLLASGSADRSVIVWQYEASTVVHMLRAHSATVRAIAFAPADASSLVSGGDDRDLRVWDLVARSTTRTLRGHTAAVNGVAWSRNGARGGGAGDAAVLASGGQDGSLVFWAPLSANASRVRLGPILVVPIQPSSVQVQPSEPTEGSIQPLTDPPR